MVQRLPETYRLDPSDPRASSRGAWSAITPEQHARVMAMRPAENPFELHHPEGDQHRKAKTRATDTLDAFFRSVGRKVYVSSTLGVCYPDEPTFVPDVLVVLDVEPHDRTKWVVSEEGKGLDLVIEIHYEGDTAKDYRLNVERYARLGIREYFIFNRALLSLRGYRLPQSSEGRGGRGRAYRPILPQQGCYVSEVLGLDLIIEGDKLRFLIGMAQVMEVEEWVAKLGARLDQELLRKQDIEMRAQAEARRADAEAARAAELEKKLAAAEALIEELKRGR